MSDSDKASLQNDGGHLNSLQDSPSEFADPLDELESWLKEDTPSDLVLRVQSITQEARFASYSGPLPHAEQFGIYERVQPGAADRILGMAERQQDLSAQQIGVQRRRINAATTVSLALIALAGVGIWQGLPWTVVVPLGLGGLVTFLLRELTGMLRKHEKTPAA